MPIPRLTALQFLALSTIEDADLPGSEIRDRLASSGGLNGLPSFYQLMGRMESLSLVAGRYEVAATGGQMIRTRRYAITGEGRGALAEARTFYSAKRGDAP